MHLALTSGLAGPQNQNGSCSKRANSVWWSGCLPSAMISVMISVFATWVSFSTFRVRDQRSPRPCRESLQMPSSTALSNEHVQAILWNVLSWNVRCLIFFGPQSLQKWLLANASAGAAAANMQTQCDDQGVCQVRWSVWWSVCLPREFPSLLFELGIKEVPDLAVSPCKCRVPLLSAMNMSKQFFETSCHGMSDAWSLICTYLWGTDKSRLNLAALMESKATCKKAKTCRDHLWHLGRVLHDACLLLSADVSERQKLSNMKNLCHTHAHYGNLYLELWDLADCGQLNPAKTIPRFNLCFMQY